MAVGAPIMLDGIAAIRECASMNISSQNRRYLKEIRKKRPQSYLPLCRAVSPSCVQSQQNPLFPIIRHELDRAIDESKIYVRRVKATAPLAHKTERTPFKRLASELGLKKDQLRRLGARLGLMPEQQPLGLYISLTRNDVRLLRQALDNLVNRHDAAAYLGLPSRDMEFLCQKEILIPFVRVGHGKPSDHFQKNDLDTLLESVRNSAPSGHVEDSVPFATYCEMSGLPWTAGSQRLVSR